MRALVTRSVRPRIGTTSSATLLSTTSPVRQAIFPPTRRKLTLSDAFTILLAPVFAAAFVADATLKDRKRRDWDQKIAEVRAEIDAIRERELQAWNLVQMKSIQVGVRSHRREYTTAARAMRSDQTTTPDSEVVYNLHDETRVTYDPNPIAAFEEMDTLESQDAVVVDQQRHGPRLHPQTIAVWQQYEALLASKLAIELILHIRTGKSWLYRQPTGILVNSELFPESLDDLMVQLQRVNDALKQLNSRKRYGQVPNELLFTPARDLLHTNITDMAKDCKEGRINVVQLVYGYASAISESQTAPRSTSYRALMSAFLTLDNASLAYTAMSALQNCQQRLKQADIGNMIFQYGHYKDSGRFNKFLRLLAKREASCILRLTIPWEHIIVNGIRIPVPVNRNARLIATCVQAALQCSMVQHAETWTAVLFQTGNRNQLGNVMKHILTYYTQHYDWKYGSRWLQEVIKRAVLIAIEHFGQLSMCILRMLELCVACDQPEMYERIMNAVVAAGIQPEEINHARPEFFSDRIEIIRGNWVSRQRRLQNAKEKPTIPPTPVEQAIRFQEILSEHDPTLRPYIGSEDGMTMTKTSDSTDVEKTKVLQFRPFHTPSELLGGDAILWRTPEGKTEVQSNGLRNEVDQDVAYQSRIIELEMRLAESQRSYSELHQKLKEQTIKSQQESIEQTQPSPTSESGLSHLHLMTDYQKLLQDHADLNSRHQILLSNHKALRQSRRSLATMKPPQRPDMAALLHELRMDQSTVSETRHVQVQDRVQPERRVDLQKT